MTIGQNGSLHLMKFQHFESSSLLVIHIRIINFYSEISFNSI